MSKTCVNCEYHRMLETYHECDKCMSYSRFMPKGYVTTEDGNSFDVIYSSLLKMQKIKDARYGNSALTPLGIFAKHHPYGSRLDEKLARVKNSEELRKNDIVDLIGGLILICKDKGWNNFDDLID